MSPETGWSLVLGASLGLGLWMLVSLAPILRRPLLLHRVAPYVLDVSSGARDLVARRRVDPLRVLGAAASPVGDRLAPIAHAVLGAPDGIRRRLRQAASSESVAEHRGRQLRWAVLGAAVGAGLGVVGVLQRGPLALPAVLAVLGAAIGAFTVDWLLQRRAKRRLARISSELPSILEFLSLSLAAGEGLQDALRRVGAAGRSALGRELAGVVSDAAAGTSLTAALGTLADELAHPGVTRSVDQMRGALERGTPLAQTLQAQALDARDAAKRDLLEAAGRKEISMLVPLVFGLLPTTVAFALWPGIHVLQVGF
ncbi:type II secretion system F family protein [Agrococcus sp. HG114]|uniref:type II secretion system F family protein n=1 Tax=Agrococcus sp. HG114 TaxID=2969757 RepID=UPI00215AC9C7|nr:type II secretion system F family protein [Agrococcus sp. HG114]MCR8671007.1 type II secretion system F family protein [Agrococcus sp. HG114]